MDGEFIAVMVAVLALLPLGAPANAQPFSAAPQARRVSWLLNRMQSPKYSDWRTSMEQPSPKFRSHYCMDCSMDQRWR
tara:strand:- start:716 stop:949 length:234 start_codon:yes stop_codon:yes gene_type:complete